MDGTAGSGTIVNEIKHAYNDFGQLQQEFQSHSGAVDNTPPTVSPNVQYAYETRGDEKHHPPHADHLSGRHGDRHEIGRAPRNVTWPICSATIGPCAS